MLAFALRNNPRAICLIKIISKWRGNASQKIDAIRKGLLRATHETENSIVISFFFPVGNPVKDKFIFQRVFLQSRIARLL